ncbi:MAG: hypothetical protein PHO56_04550 [Patescibacteria group bacterium]|nr:hypothetical protein [Patescibacteria group bacterium]
MKIKSFSLYLSFFFFLFSFLISRAALAVCPVCTVAVVGGIELSRYLGVDDSVTGLWVGGLTVSLIFWTIDWLNKKNIRFKGRKILVTLGYYALVVLPLYFLKIIHLRLPRYQTFCGCGIDKMTVGIASGSIAFLIGVLLYEYLKKKNNGHAHFPFEKIVFPIAPLIILSFVFYYLTK